MTSPAHGNIGWVTGGSLHRLQRFDAFDRRRAVPRRRDDGRMESLVGEWAELGEDMLSFEVLACTACRRVELRIPPGRN